MQKQPRGIRNNNPGNIDYHAANKWKGQLGIEQDVAKPRFARFDTPENGIRAIAKILLNYRNKHGLLTIKGMINRWAPPIENDTGSYAKAVARAVGIHVNATIPTLGTRVLIPMVTAIIHHENGYQPYDELVIAEAVMSALQ